MQHIDHGVFTFVYDTNFGMKTMGKNKICTILIPLLCWNFFLFSVVTHSSSSTQEK